MKNVAKVTNKPVQQGGSRLMQVIDRMADARLCITDIVEARANDPDRLLIALLREVDETVLPRVLELQNGDGDCARLAVHNRRLCSVEIAEGGLQDVSQEPDAVAQLFVNRLRGFLDGQNHLYITRRRSIGAEGEEAISCSALNLARFGGIALSELGYAAGLSGFLQAAEPHATAWLSLPGRDREPRQGGDSNKVRVLQEFHAKAKEMKKGQIARVRPQCTLLALANDQFLLRAEAGGDVVLALIPASARRTVMQAWQKRI